MNEKQESLLRKANEAFLSWNDSKFREGDHEHGGNLSDMSELDLINNALDECIDQFNYLFCLREKLQTSSKTSG